MNNSKRSELVFEYLDRISKSTFDKYPKQLTELIGNQPGVYALYENKKLYYVGLASDLKQRLRQHRNDQHADLWDRFSLYLINDASHLKDLETLIIHIANPTGNRTKGKFTRATNLRKRLNDSVKAAQDRERGKIFDDLPKSSGSKTTASNPKRLKLKATFQGESYTAILRADDTVVYNGKIYKTSSGAGKAVTGWQTCRGPTFWKYENEQGQWVAIKELPKQPPKPAGGKAKTVGRAATKSGKGAKLYLKLKPWFHGLGNDVQEVKRAQYDAYKRSENFASVVVYKKTLKIYVSLDPSEERIIDGFTRNVTDIGHHGTGDLEILVANDKQLEMAKPIVRRSYHAQGDRA